MYLLKKVFNLREKAHPEHEKPFLEHLDDLRVMVTRIVITLLISMIVCFMFQGELMSILRRPAEEVVKKKQELSMPDVKKHEGLGIPSLEVWNRAKDVEGIVAGLSEGERKKFFEGLKEETKIEYYVRCVSLLRAAKALPEGSREGFVNGIEADGEMKRLVLAMLEAGTDTEASSGSNIKMMSALKPTETFMLSMKLAFFAGITLAFPLLLYFILQFVLPGLHANEKRVMWPALLVGFGLFLGGVCFAYFYVLPRALLFFYDWSSALGVSNDWRIGEYITFATQFTLLFGLSFELPVVVMVLVKLGLLSYDTMKRTRAYAILGVYVTAAIITPTPDIMTLNLMAIPMLVLYEICIWLAWFDRKKTREKEEREEAELKKRREEWLLSMPDEPEEVKEEGDDGWHDEYHHRYPEHGEGDPFHHDSYEEDHAHYDVGKPGDEDWVEPKDAVTGEGENNKDQDKT